MNIIYPIIIMVIACCVLGDGKMLKSLKSEDIVLITLGIWLFTVTMINKEGFTGIKLSASDNQKLWWRNPSVPYGNSNTSTKDIDALDYWTTNIGTHGDENINKGICYNTAIKCTSRSNEAGADETCADTAARLKLSPSPSNPNCPDGCTYNAETGVISSHWGIFPVDGTHIACAEEFGSGWMWDKEYKISGTDSRQDKKGSELKHPWWSLVILVVTFIITCNNAFWIGANASVKGRMGFFGADVFGAQSEIPDARMLSFLAIIPRFIMLFVIIIIGFGIIYLINGNIQQKKWTYKLPKSAAASPENPAGSWLYYSNAAEATTAEANSSKISSFSSIEDIKKNSTKYFWTPVSKETEKALEVLHPPTDRTAIQNMHANLNSASADPGQRKLRKFSDCENIGDLRDDGDILTCVLKEYYPPGWDPTKEWDEKLGNIHKAGLRDYVAGIGTFVITFFIMSVVWFIIIPRYGFFLPKLGSETPWWKRVAFWLVFVFVPSFVAGAKVFWITMDGELPKYVSATGLMEEFITPISILIFFVFMLSILIAVNGGYAETNYMKGDKKFKQAAQGIEDARTQAITAGQGLGYPAPGAPAPVQALLDALPELTAYNFTQAGWKSTFFKICLVILFCASVSGYFTSTYWPKYHGKIQTRPPLCGEEGDDIRCVNKSTGEPCGKDPHQNHDGSYSCGDDKNCVIQKGCLYVSTDSAHTDPDSIDITQHVESSQGCIDKYLFYTGHEEVDSKYTFEDKKKELDTLLTEEKVTDDEHTQFTLELTEAQRVAELCNSQSATSCNTIQIGRCLGNRTNFTEADGELLDSVCEYMNNRPGQCDSYGGGCVAKDPDNDNGGVLGAPGTDGIQPVAKCEDLWDREDDCRQLRHEHGSGLVCKWVGDQKENKLCQYFPPDTATEALDSPQARCKFRGPAGAWADQDMQNPDYWKDMMLYSLPILSEAKMQHLYTTVGMDPSAAASMKKVASARVGERGEIAERIEENRIAITDIFQHVGVVPHTPHDQALDQCTKKGHRKFCPSNQRDTDLSADAVSSGESRCKDGTPVSNLSRINALGDLHSSDDTPQDIKNIFAGTFFPTDEGTAADALDDFIEQVNANANSAEEIKKLPCCVDNLTHSPSEGVYSSSATVSSTIGSGKVLYKRGDTSTPCIKPDDDTAAIRDVCYGPNEEQTEIYLGTLTAQNNQNVCADESNYAQADVLAEENQMNWDGLLGTCVKACDQDCPLYPVDPIGSGSVAGIESEGEASSFMRCRKADERLHYDVPIDVIKPQLIDHSAGSG